MTKQYVFVRSPLKAAQLLDKGFPYVKTPFAKDQAIFVFESSDALREYLAEHFAASEYTVSNQALICF